VVWAVVLFCTVHPAGASPSIKTNKTRIPDIL
jgi:hypothetical protein